MCVPPIAFSPAAQSRIDELELRAAELEFGARENHEAWGEKYRAVLLRAEGATTVVLTLNARIAELEEGLRLALSALERTEANFKHAVSNKPVRDMAENLGENRHAFDIARSLLAASGEDA